MNQSAARIIKIILYTSAFICLGLSGILVRLDPDRELFIFRQEFNAKIVGLSCIVMSVALYLAARVLGVLLKYKAPDRV
jgi:hypothetical protein